MCRLKVAHMNSECRSQGTGKRLPRSLSNVRNFSTELKMKSRASKVNRGFALAAGTALALCTLAVSPGARESADLQYVAASQNDCDRLAGSPFDQQRNSAYSPVDIGNIDSYAVNACQVAYDATGNPRFAYQLGRALNKADRAMSAYNLAVQANYPAAQVNFGMLMGRLGDQKAELQFYTEAGQRGNVLAAYNLGVAYRDGLGTAPDVNKALSWFEKAAAEGDSTAAFNIGAIHDEGQLLPQDDQLAIAWYDLAAQRGNVDAMINLGLMYEAGEGIEANPGKAADMYRQAAIRGDVFGASKFLQMQELGIVPPAADPPALEGVSSLVLKPGDWLDPAMSAHEI